MSTLDRLRSRAIANRMILSMARANYRQARKQGEWPVRWAAMIAWHGARAVLPWNLLLGEVWDD